MTTSRTPYVYVGLAGETAPGRPMQSGLYRMAVGDDRWELATRGLPEAPAIRAIAAHPEHPGHRVCRHAARPLPQHGLRGALGEARHRGSRLAGVVAAVRSPRSAGAVRGLRELRDLPQRGRRRALAAAAGDRPLPGGDRGPGVEPRQACAGAGRQSRQPQRDLRCDRGGRHHPQPRRRRALGEHEPWPVPERRHRGHARRARGALASGDGPRHRSRRPVPQHGPGRALGERPARAAERQGTDVLP